MLCCLPLGEGGGYDERREGREESDDGHGGEGGRMVTGCRCRCM